MYGIFPRLAERPRQIAGSVSGGEQQMLTDPEPLGRAAELERVLFTRDADLLAEATRRRRTSRSFAGLVYAHQLHVTIGQCVHDLELIATAMDPTDLTDRVEYLPLR